MTTMTHGLEVLPLSKPSFELMEQAHGTIAKMVQGIPKQTANVTPTATLGWRSLECHLDLLRMMFLWRVLLLPMNNIYKQMTLIRLCYHMYEPDNVHLGPVFEMIKTFDKYSMLNILDCALKTGDMMSINVFKKMAKDTVDSVENARFRITCLLYKSLPLFNACITKIGMWQWWVFCNKYPEYAFKVKFMYRILVSKSCLSADTCMYSGMSPVCPLCTDNVSETAYHMFFDCKTFTNSRANLWREVEHTVPVAMLEELNRMNSRQKSEFIISAFRCDYTEEWSDMYMAIANFVYHMYKKRQSLNE